LDENTKDFTEMLIKHGGTKQFIDHYLPGMLWYWYVVTK